MYPSRIICLTEETTETLYLLGEGDRVVGVSAYTVRPPEARRKPRVSAFINANFEQDRGPATRRDLRVLGPAGRHRRRTGAPWLPRLHLQPAVGGGDSADDPRRRRDRRPGGSGRGAGRQAEVGSRVDRGCRRRVAPAAPRVLRGVGRPADLGDPVGGGTHRMCGRIAVFPELAGAGLAKHRIVDPVEVVARDPEVIVASWCGKAVKPGAHHRLVLAGMPSPPCATGTSTRLSRSTSCNPARPP